MRPAYRWELRTRSLELGPRTLIAGVVNVTPDSFSDGGQFLHPDKALEHALRLLDEGADIVDIGGESTRPGVSTATAQGSAERTRGWVSEEEEVQRVIPVIQALRQARPQVIISVDTYKPAVAKAAVAAGAEIVNDVSGFTWDDNMPQVCAELQCGVVLMHTRGRPEEWRRLPALSDVVTFVQHELANRVQIALERGVVRERIVVDPGFGFGKGLDENYPLLARLNEFESFAFPVMVGTSRKAFIGHTIAQRTGREVPPAERLFGSIAAMVAGILGGAHIVRVHDVKPAVEAAAVADAVLASLAP